MVVGAGGLEGNEEGWTYVELSTVLVGGGVDGDVLGAEEVVTVGCGSGRH